MDSAWTWRRWLPWATLAGLGVMAILAFVAARPVTAQTPGLQLEKTLLKNSNVVQVGETLTFAITITNNWNTTVITLPLIDDYDESVMRFLDATPAPDTIIAATGVISWNNVLATTGPLAPGQQIVILVRFIAEHPSPRVVNRAATHDAYDAVGNAVGNGSGQDENIAEGGNTPLEKTLALGQPQVGQLITFNLTITNDGAATVLSLPIRDRFDPAALEFVSAQPQIDGESPGVLVWSNALRPPLPTELLPHASVTLTVTFRVIGNVQQTTNQAEVIGATDAFGNDLAPAADDVPIQIIGVATTIPTATRVSNQPAPTDTAATATVAATSTATSATATATPQATAVGSTPTPTVAAPESLPDTSGTASTGLWIILTVLGLGLLALRPVVLRGQR